jgi:hypothetical protein
MKKKLLLAIEIGSPLLVIALGIAWLMMSEAHIEPFITIITAITALAFILLHRNKSTSDGEPTNHTTLPALPIHSIEIRQPNSSIKCATLKIRFSEGASLKAPAKITIETLNIWPFRIIQTAVHIERWPNSSALNIEVPNTTGHSISIHRMCTPGIATTSIDLALMTTEVLSTNGGIEYEGVIAYLLNVKIQIHGYEIKELLAIPVIYGGFARMTVQKGVPDDELMAQLAYVDQIEAAVSGGAVICPTQLRALRLRQDVILKRMSSG